MLWHRLADSSVSVCVSSHSRNQFALCGTVDTERGDVSKTRAGHMQAAYTARANC